MGWQKAKPWSAPTNLVKVRVYKEDYKTQKIPFRTPRSQYTERTHSTEGLLDTGAQVIIA